LVASDKGTSGLDFPASLLEVSLEVNYVVRRDEVRKFAFHFYDVQETLSMLAWAEATAYFASTDFMRSISSGRGEMASNLQERIQNSADRLGMGIEIVTVNVLDAHPPVGRDSGQPGQETVNVASAFQDVINAAEEAKAMRYAALAFQKETVQSAMAESLSIVNKATAYKYDVSSAARADSARFTSQLTAFRAMPGIFKLRQYLNFLENDCADKRKFIVPYNIPSLIYEMDMTEKPRLDLLDADIGNLGR